MRGDFSGMNVWKQWVADFCGYTSIFMLISNAISNSLFNIIKAFIDLGENLSPLPYPMNNSSLIKKNSYKNTRHPLYRGLLFISLGICIFSLSLIHLSLLNLLGVQLNQQVYLTQDLMLLLY